MGIDGLKCVCTISNSKHWRLVSIIFEASAPTFPPGLNEEKPRVFLGTRERNENQATEEITEEMAGSDNALSYLIAASMAAIGSDPAHLCLGGLILPAAEGCIIRSDIIPLRLFGFPAMDTVLSFAAPLQHFNVEDLSSTAPISQLLCAAAAGFLINPVLSPTGEPQTIFADIESELRNRLSLPWVLPRESVQEKTLVIVEGGRFKPEVGGIAGLIYPAVKALGIRMIVIDEPGHWLQDAEYDSWRHAFLPVEFSFDEGVLADRVVEALQAYKEPIHGILTFCDSFQIEVCKAAERLGLPTLPLEAYQKVTNKYETSLAEGAPSHRGFSVEDAISISKEEGLCYPLIVKPCNGWSSEGVFRVDNASQLVEAVKQIDQERHGVEFVVQPYYDGPEIDINMVTYGGEVLFHEMSDDYPKSAEVNGTGVSASFVETDTILPSDLPESERSFLKKTTNDIMSTYKLDHGVFNVEGRLTGSSVEYKLDEAGIWDLHQKASDVGPSNPAFKVIDLNPRPPGFTFSVAPLHTYGVDYHALSMLIAVRDEARVRALAQPFARGNQYWCAMVCIPPEFPEDRAGVFASDDICAELMERRPDLAKHISSSLCLYKRGDMLPHPKSGRNTFVAYINVISRESRRHLLELARTVRMEIRYLVE